MVKRCIQLKDITSVAAGRKAVINCPLGPRYHRIGLVLGNSAAANANAPTVSAIAGEVTLLMNGAIQRRALASHIDAINTGMGSDFASQAYTGSGNGTGRRMLPIYFGEPWRKRLADQDALAWQTGWMDRKGTFQVEVQLAADVTPVLTAFAIVDDFNGGKPHGIMKWFSYDFPAVGSPVQINTLERKDLYSQISLFNTIEDTPKSVSAVRLVVGGVEIHDLTYNENANLLKNTQMNPAAGRYDVVFDFDDALDDVLPTSVSDMQLTATMSAAASGTMPVVTQRLGLPE